MKVLTVSLVSLLFIVLTFACVNRESVAEKESTTAVAQRLIGEYAGTLPCVDCEYIDTQLQLNTDRSYVLRYIYEGKSDDQFVKEGAWSIENNKLVLKGVDYKFKILKESLVQLDLSGNEISGDLADNYLLAKQDF